MYPATNPNATGTLHATSAAEHQWRQEQEDRRDRQRELLNRIGRAVLDLALFTGVMGAIIWSVYLALR